MRSRTAWWTWLNRRWSSDLLMAFKQRAEESEWTKSDAAAPAGTGGARGPDPEYTAGMANTLPKALIGYRWLSAVYMKGGGAGDVGEGDGGKTTPQPDARNWGHGTPER